ncbi:putative reverse transcriptase domain-containing protein [Tanacetum coccineum]
MMKLTQKGIKFDWGKKEENAFQLIKQNLCSAPILALLEGSKDFVVYYDALHKGLGAVLMQREKVTRVNKARDLRVLQIGIRAKVIENKGADDEDEEEEEHLAPADSTIVVPVDEPVIPPEGTEPVTSPPSTDITIGARITVRPQTSVSLPPEAEYTLSTYHWRSDPEEDPEEYEDDETEDGPVDYPMDGGDDGDDDDGNSSRDDANDGDEDNEDEDEEEEEEHLALADSTIVVPVDEPVVPPEGTEPVIPPPFTDITIGARITVRPQTSISLPPEVEVERILAVTTPSPSPPISLSPPSAGERLARISSTQALINAVIAALPLPPLPPLLPSLYIPPPVDRRDDIPESEQPPRKRLYLSTLGSRYEVGESSTTRPTKGRGIDYGFVSTIDAEERRQGTRDVGYGIRDTWVDPVGTVPEIAPMTMGDVNTRVTELVELHEHDTQDLYALLDDDDSPRDSMDGGRGGICFPKGLGSLDRIESCDSSGASDPS